MGRWLAIDYGRVRCGLAVTDPARIIATGLDTVKAGELMGYLRAYFARETVDLVVMGAPLQTSGAPSENMARVERFVRSFTKAFPDIPVRYFDERFTSVLAHRAMLDGGLTRSRRRDKALVDKVSACILLQSFMESERQCNLTKES